MSVQDFKKWINKNITCPFLSPDDIGKLAKKMREIYEEGYVDGYKDNEEDGLPISY